MPTQNRFGHQHYPSNSLLPPVYLSMETALPPSLDPFPTRLERLRIRHALLVHGTFLGPDPLGLLALLEGFSLELPTAFRTAILAGTQLFGSQAHHVTDFLAGDIGNYSSEVCKTFQQLTGSGTSIERLHPSWSSENNHLARAQLALKLLLWLEDLEKTGFSPSEERILFWGHSHAGNGFALLSNLLGGDADSRTAFFDRIGDSLDSLGTTARELMATAPTPHPMAQALHLVTFGTPVRYGWDTDGYRSLTHWIHHNPMNEETPEQSPPALHVGADSDPGPHLPGHSGHSLGPLWRLGAKFRHCWNRPATDSPSRRKQEPRRSPGADPPRTNSRSVARPDRYRGSTLESGASSPYRWTKYFGPVLAHPVHSVWTRTCHDFRPRCLHHGELAPANPLGNARRTRVDPLRLDP